MTLNFGASDEEGRFGSMLVQHREQLGYRFGHRPVIERERNKTALRAYFGDWFSERLVRARLGDLPPCDSQTDCDCRKQSEASDSTHEHEKVTGTDVMFWAGE